MVYLTGYGFPMHRGGPMNYADTVGLFNVVQAMKRFAANPHDDADVLAAGAAAREARGRRQDVQLKLSPQTLTPALARKREREHRSSP